MAKAIPAPVKVILGVVAVFVVGLLVWKPPQTSSDAAAWAQAATAAVTIAAALFAVIWQYQLQVDREAKRAWLARGRRLEVAHQLSAYTQAVTMECIQLCGSATPDIDELEKALGKLHAVGRSFDKYRADDFPRYEDLSPLLATIAIRNAIEIRVMKACEVGRRDPIGIQLKASLEALISDLEVRVMELHGLTERFR